MLLQCKAAQYISQTELFKASSQSTRSAVKPAVIENVLVGNDWK